MRLSCTNSFTDFPTSTEEKQKNKNKQKQHKTKQQIDYSRIRMSGPSWCGFLPSSLMKLALIFPGRIQIFSPKNCVTLWRHSYSVLLQLFCIPLDSKLFYDRGFILFIFVFSVVISNKPYKQQVLMIIFNEIASKTPW